MDSRVAHLLAEAAAAIDAGWWVEAESALEQARRIDPKCPDVLIQSGRVQLGLGRPLQALPVLKRAVGLSPGLAAAHALFGLALSASGRHGEAIAALERAARLVPSDGDVRFHLGVVLQAAGQSSKAIVAFRAAAAIAPGFAPAWFNLGNLLREAGAIAEAEHAYRAALAARPGDVPTLINLGGLLMSADRPAESLDCFERLLTDAPCLAIAHDGRGSALAALGRLESALDAARQAVALDPDAAEFRYNLGCHLSRLGLVEAAIGAFQAALAIDPSHGPAAQNLLLELNKSDRWSREALAAAHRQWATVSAPMARSKSAALAAPAADPVAVRRMRHRAGEQARLRMGFVSADLHQHSVAFFLLPLLRSLDRTRCVAFCYSNSRRCDATTGLLRAASDGWRDISALAAGAAADEIRRDGIDLLVDLSGHTGGSRLDVFVQRPAAMQMNWLGYPNTTGHPEIGWRLVDRWTDPAEPEIDALATERLLRLERCFVCYGVPPEAAAAAAALPERRPDRPVVFGSFSAIGKITPATIALWSAVLRAVPDARFVLKSTSTDQPGTRARLAEAFSEHAVDASRLHLLPRDDDFAAHLARYGEIDIALDTFPYHGTTTTCEALAMGVPVVSHVGDRHASRVGASLLAAVGEPSWAVESPAAYVECAAGLADQVCAGRRDRVALRRQVAASALCDAPAFARAFVEAIPVLC